MDALLIVVVAFVGYILAYYTYGRFLARKIFRLRPDAVTPSHALHDGVDFVPTRRGIVFGHHYTSIAGTGPIVGPAIGIIWGWVPALLWVFVGSIVMGAVHDFGALVVSLRNEGKSISEVTARYINPRVRTIFFVIVFLALLIVIAIFGVVIAFVFDTYKEAVLPIWGQIPIAVLLGLLVYRWRGNLTMATMVSVAAMYLLVVAGQFVPLEITPGAAAAVGMTPTGLWVLILLVYVYIASTLPVTVLLQPRDYINAWQLFIAMGLLVAGVVAATFKGGLSIVAPAFNATPAGAPPMWPFLCITIACGAISGFHSLVASGTTAKQVRHETDALFVGFGSMLMEGALAVLVIVAVAAGIGLAYTPKGSALTLTGTAAWSQHYASWTAAEGLGSKVDAFVIGSANILAAIGIPTVIGVTFIGVFVASFAGTTLDTATRIQRYVFSELATSIRLPALANRWVATAIVVVAAGGLAFATGADGKGALTLWPMFGAVNQLLAALALLVVTIYLRRHGSWGFVLTLLPCLFMLTMTVWAMVSNELTFVARKVSDAFPAYQKWTLVGVNALTLLLAVVMTVEAFITLLSRQPRDERAAS